MKHTIACVCSECQKYGEVAVESGITVTCPYCRHAWGKVEGNIDSGLTLCPVCQCRQFYLSKDFNQFVGCLVMLIGIVLVPFTYGLSLPVFALLDWMLHHQIPTIVNCYKCGCEFRGFETKEFKPFIHQIGMKYDKSRLHPHR